jgi:spoIIIJ-associated protein
MNEKRASLEIIAPTIEEAIARGLEELGLPEDLVDIEVLDSGSKGLFGLGSRQARVRLKIKGSAMNNRVEVMDEIEAPAEAVIEPPLNSSYPVEIEEEREEPVAAMTPFIPASSASTPATTASPLSGSQPDDTAVRVAQETVRDLLDKMKIRANITAHLGEADDDRSRVPVWVDIHGNDLSILIGPRAEILNAFQYIASLIVSNEIGHSVSLVVDVEGFRARRAQQLRQLARRMADQAVKTGHRQILEPMPAGERRLIHIELRTNPQVTTESVGEEPRRKVTIIPKS